MTESEQSEPAAEDSMHTLYQRIAELERQLPETTLLRERVAELEQRKLGVSLESIKTQLGVVEGRMKSVESRRDAWIRTLLLTLAAPLAAGVFGQFSKQRDMEVKRFEQNLELVDRALDYEKGESYREGVLEYINELNEDGEAVTAWALGQLAEVRGQLEDVRKIAGGKREQVETKKGQIDQKNQDILQLRAELERNNEVAGLDPTKLDALDDTLIKIEQTRVEAELLQAEVEVEAEEASELALRAGLAPVSSAGVNITAPTASAVATEQTPEQYYIQVASFSLDTPKLARDKIQDLAKVEVFNTVVLTRKPYFFVMIGPYGDSDSAEQARKMLGADLDAGAKIRQLDEFCSTRVRVEGGLLCPSLESRG